MRRTLAREVDAVASSIARVLAEHPGLQSGDDRAEADILTDAVAVRLYLSPPGAAIDEALREARKGPHVPFARCVVAGLTRLPSHRGVTTVAVSPGRAEWELLRNRRFLTEWGFLNALTAPAASLPGDTDLLIWSMTARRTSLLEPAGESGAEQRVLFLPGTSFKLLDVREPAGDVRGQILLREVAATEIGAGGQVDNGRIPFDDLATRALTRAVRDWAGDVPAVRVGDAAAPRFGTIPGLR